MISIVLEVNFFHSLIFRWLRLPRELRCHSRELTIVGQQFVLPLWTAYALYYLAQADLFSVRFDDCQVKIDGISNILRSSSNITYDNKPLKEDFSKLQIENLATELSEIMLDVPVTGRIYQASSGSPVLFTNPFKFPSFINHDMSCLCKYCCTNEYQELVFINIYLEMQMSALQNNVHSCKDLLKCAKILHKFVENKFDAKIIGYSYFQMQQINFGYCLTLMEYTNVLIRLGHKEEAEMINNEVMDIIEKNKLKSYFNNYLYAEAIEQKLCISWPSEEVQYKSMLEVVNSNGSELKTPENKISTVIVKAITPASIEILKPVIKCIKFDLSDDEEQNIKRPSPEQSLIKISKSVLKTPAASKISVYTPVSIKTVKKNKSTKVEVSKENINSNLVVKESPEAYSASYKKSAKKMETYLNSRTKLLTDKLKTVCDINVKNSVSGTSQRSRVKKKKISELIDEPKIDNVAVRKSSRNIKK